MTANRVHRPPQHNTAEVQRRSTPTRPRQFDPISAIGLPRPKANGLPVPWITPSTPQGPKWLGYDPALLLRCQSEWRCQVCGDRLPPTAWVILAPDRTVVINSAMHRTCLRIAQRWCPALNSATISPIEVDRAIIHADGKPLLTYTEPDMNDEFGSYGDGVRTWTIP
ncbi:hypothetical protein [Nocardia carnea]|uniref:hypothetical protein n=1 Tax=Nocardia carnea TaxID=37328 RepID=UPI002456AEB5|nr:hypothetical protein [Nocardia carnea]